MLICDLHCDLPYKVIDGRDIHSNEGHFAEDKLKSEHTYVQVFANFVNAQKFPDSFNYIDKMIHIFKDRLKETNIGLVTSYSDLESNIKTGKNSAILSVEGGEALDGKLENIEYFYNLGIRFLTLTWNYPNALGESCKTGDAPLTDFGREVVKEMNRIKMFPDVSHLCEKGFWDVAELCDKIPFVATHSNSRKLCGHERNLTDEQFVEIKNKGGLVGINYCPYFLEDNGDDADISSIIRHIEHFLALGGEDVLALGGDLDGIGSLPKGMSSVSDVDVIATELQKLNYSDKLIAKIMGENTAEFIKKWF